MLATQRLQAACVWVALCFVFFLLMFIVPVQGARAPQGYWYQCPSLSTIARLRADPHAEDDRMSGLTTSRAYIACRKGPATRWAAASVLLPTLLCLSGFVSFARADSRARLPQ
ncbi:hypothetical protein GCM10025782_01360 [Pedococcus ginsenosidimutans]|uniref:Uncharacterized protein n=1 Tax=Pedococcus ginsenosidimutans TaxID=490570 RepID=A0ABP8XIY9_9MICO